MTWHRESDIQYCKCGLEKIPAYKYPDEELSVEIYWECPDEYCKYRIEEEVFND